MKIAIATPCQDTVHAGYTYDLARLVGYVVKAQPDVELTIHQNRGTIIPQQRATLVMSSVEAGADSILWIDSDMRFPPDALQRLLDHDEPIVAANYSTRRKPYLPTAEHREHGYLFTPEHAMGLAEVTHCGMGFMLTAMSVFGKIPKPYFAIGYSQADGEYAGEDFFFCRRAREAGFRVMIDQSLSKEIRHAGLMEFSAEHTIITRDACAPPEVSSGA